jgi:hypothetical protein
MPLLFLLFVEHFKDGGGACEGDFVAGVEEVLLGFGEVGLECEIEAGAVGDDGDAGCEDESFLHGWVPVGFG